MMTYPNNPTPAQNPKYIPRQCPESNVHTLSHSFNNKHTCLTRPVRINSAISPKHFLRSGITAVLPPPAKCANSRSAKTWPLRPITTKSPAFLGLVPTSSWARESVSLAEWVVSRDSKTTREERAEGRESRKETKKAVSRSLSSTMLGSAVLMAEVVISTLSVVRVREGGTVAASGSAVSITSEVEMWITVAVTLGFCANCKMNRRATRSSAPPKYGKKMWWLRSAIGVVIVISRPLCILSPLTVLFNVGSTSLDRPPKPLLTKMAVASCVGESVDDELIVRAARESVLRGIEK